MGRQNSLRNISPSRRITHQPEARESLFHGIPQLVCCEKIGRQVPGDRAVVLTATLIPPQMSGVR